MPKLPNLDDISQEQFDRIAASFPGNTAEEKVESYRAWLVNHLIDWVVTYEVSLIDQELDSQRQARVQQVLDSLPPRPSFEGRIRPAPVSAAAASLLPDGS